MNNHRPEAEFQQHIAEYLKSKHGYTVLEADDITDKDYYIATPLLMAFIRATQTETLKKLEADYGALEAQEKIISALKKALNQKPLWLVMREGLTVGDYSFLLYYPKPRSSMSIANQHWQQNRFSFKTELVIQDDKRPDIVLFLNGLPIIVIELKHEKGGQTVHDAVTQFNNRNQQDAIFKLPFLYVAMDTADIKVATNPSKAQYFLWHNQGLTNQAQNAGEYPVEFFYRDVLAKENLLTVLSFYLIYVPEKDDKSAYTLFPRYHQSRLVNHLSADIAEHFLINNNVGKKYLVNHSAGSGKTLTISWLAERLHSLYKEDIKLFDMVFILTDRKELDKNIQDELDSFSHLSTQMTYAKKSKYLLKAINERQSIIVTTIQKFQYIFEILKKDNSLESCRIAFLIDEAHRSQEGKNARAIRSPFNPDSPETIEQAEDSIEEINKVLKAYQPNQTFVAFTATPTNSTVQLFGEAFDTYSEAEAIEEGYIIDVASQIISYDTLYHLSSPLIPNKEEEKLYPKGIVNMLLKRQAFEDDGLIQYKAEIILRTFEEEIKPLINHQAKAMIVTSSRIAGLKYFTILKEKIAEKQKNNPEQYNYKVLYAFSDFTHKNTNEEIREHQINELENNEKIEDRFAQADYRLMVVASKFQTGFNEPLLAGMFLDKPVLDKNAVQTLSRLNRCHEGKDKVIVVDFTNNTDNIIKAFNKYRKGSPYEASEPNQEKVINLYQAIIERGLFTDKEATDFLTLLKSGIDADIQSRVNQLRQRLRFFYETISEQKDYVYQLDKLVKAFNFLSSFYQYSEEIERFVFFAEIIGSQLIKEGSESELMKEISNVFLSKAAVNFLGAIGFTPEEIKKLSRNGGNTPPTPPHKTTIQLALDEIKSRYDISDEEAIIIREVCEEKQADQEILETISHHKDRPIYLNEVVKDKIKKSIKQSYKQRRHFKELMEKHYIDDGAIFDMMAHSVLTYGLAQAGIA